MLHVLYRTIMMAVVRTMNDESTVVRDELWLMDRAASRVRPSPKPQNIVC